MTRLENVLLDGPFKGFTLKQVIDKNVEWVEKQLEENDSFILHKDAYRYFQKVLDMKLLPDEGELDLQNEDL